ncbi:MAG: CRISPR-associated protein [Promethearchaeota archaeon]
MNQKDIQEIMKSREILFIFDARDCNPNGERQAGILGPRIDPDTGKVIITDVCLKRTLRTYFINFHDNKNDNIYSVRKVPYINGKEIPLSQLFLKQLGLTDKEVKMIKGENELYQYFIKHFLDHRLFGSIFTIRKKQFAVTGPVQFENSFSMNIPKIQEITITSTLASEKEKGAGSIGKYSILKYAVFLVHGIVKQSLAKKSGGTEKDIEKLYDGLWNSLKSLITRSKIQQMSRLIIGLVMKDPRKQIMAIKNSIELTSDKVIGFNECVFKMDDFISLIEKHKKEIEIIEYKEDPNIIFRFKDQIFHSITNINKFVQNCPEFVEIQTLP